MATITTKFNVGDSLFTVDGKTMKIRQFTVGAIVVGLYENHHSASYRAKGDSIYADTYDEKNCFATKHELLNYLDE